MKQINLRLLSLSIVCLLFMLTFKACKNAEEQKSDESVTEEVQNDLKQTYFQIPAPTELFDLLKVLGVKPSKQIKLNPVSNISNYNDSQSKALNFGVYTTDLLFCSAFNQKAEVMKYFENLKQLADEIGIANVITDNTMTRIEKNLNNNDSLDAITNDVFFEASENLESSGKQSTLILVITGSWVEGVYIATQMMEKFDAESEIASRIAEQKYSLENLIAYFNANADDESLEEIKNKLIKLYDLFETIVEEKTTSTSAAAGQKTIGSDTMLKMTEAQFKNISSQINDLRTHIINQNTK